ncbi:MAG TPA: bifunctional glutamate N-acetyltransferase/amino-acid acetyltransferase ArgJ [Candidatus Atribacteria bacterium]|nr:bifunctional glutamate N-acetyltransferase/amino-acid acetyltransferase ArgJ [Candidatus Atribacteria bacterium]
MESWKVLEGGLDNVSGFSSYGIHCGIKEGKNDLAAILCDMPAVAAGVFTQNRVSAAPVVVTREHLLKERKLQLVVANSGVANACTGERGIEDARVMADLAARYFKVDHRLVAVASTGVIGEFLPLPKIEKGIEELSRLLPAQKSSREATKAIMTTDTFPKERALSFSWEGKTVHLGGIAKGSGMIRPNLATMLSFIVTDLGIDALTLDGVLKEAVNQSFNRVTVDGDTSTNDMVLILANGKSGVEAREKDPVFSLFREALFWLTQELARDLARDGEGATKFVEVIVRGARTEEEARRGAFTVAESPLVKTALFGEDPNWGRIMAALGRSGIEITPPKVSLQINGVTLVEGGMKAEGVGREEAQEAMRKKELKIIVDLGIGKGEFAVWTCDLSLDYVRINSHYS